MSACPDEVWFTISQEEAFAEIILDSREIYVDLIWVNLPARRQGRARSLMQSVIKLSDFTNLPVRLNARSDNVGDPEWIAFFQSLGFVLVDPNPWANEMVLT